MKYWTRDQWDKYCADNKGKTNGLAQTIGKRGRPAKRTSDELDENNDHDAKHPYIETVEGRPVSSLHLHRIGVKARAIWTSLANRGLAPEKFKKMDMAAKEYYFTEICNEFFEFRLCSDAWKLDLWSSKNYSSWSQNHLEEKKENAKRRKIEKTMKANELTTGSTSATTGSSNDSESQATQPPTTQPPPTSSTSASQAPRAPASLDNPALVPTPGASSNTGCAPTPNAGQATPASASSSNAGQAPHAPASSDTNNSPSFENDW